MCKHVVYLVSGSSKVSGWRGAGGGLISVSIAEAWKKSLCKQQDIEVIRREGVIRLRCSDVVSIWLNLKVCPLRCVSRSNKARRDRRS